MAEQAVTETGPPRKVRRVSAATTTSGTSFGDAGIELRSGRSLGVPGAVAGECVEEDEGEDPTCWLCLDGASVSAGLLEQSCSCPARFAHRSCLARWQERHCRFCQHTLPDWKHALPPVDHAAVEIRVVCGGRVHRLVARPGQDYNQFQDHVWGVCGLPEGTPLELSFNFNDPFTGDSITVQGSGAYDAAITCGAITAFKASGAAAVQGVTTPPRIEARKESTPGNK